MEEPIVEGGKVLVNFNDILWEDLVGAHRNDGLVWTQKEVKPWWGKLEYNSEEEARADGEIESENYIRDYRFLTSETDRFNVSLIQGPSRGRTSPQGFIEELEFVFKTPVLRDNLPTAYSLLPNADFNQTQRDYYNSPRFSLERHLNFNVPNVALKSDGLVDGMYARNGIHQIPEIEKLVRTLVTFTHPKDVLFNGKGLEDSKVRDQLGDFRLNLQASYGIANTGQGGIHVSGYHYGT
ncbi:MAG: hypothetical protein Q7R87_04455 [Nanoarchaeota archaeon]|nr:hypothetical protein [Nanoarchaeota archaeon]